MNDSVRESLSALMDGEASELELRRLLANADAAQREQWASMHRMRAVIREEGLPFADLDISSRVQLALDGEQQEVHRGGFRQTLAGLAVAAGVAAVVVFGANLGNVVGGDSGSYLADSGRVYPAQMSTATRGGIPVSAQAQAIPERQYSVVPAPEADPLAAQQARERFEALLRKHTDNAALNNGQGIISYARVVNQETE